MSQFTIHQAKTHLSRLLKRVAAGEEIIIANGTHPVARLVPIESKKRRMIGEDKGLFAVPDDFNDPMPNQCQEDQS